MKISLHYNDLPDSVVLIGDVAIDTEAMGLKNHRDRLCLVQLCDEEGAVHLVQFRKNDDGIVDFSAKNLKNLLLDKKIQKIFHYARFDIAIMMHYLNLPTIENIFCTKIASKLTRTYTEHHGLRTIVGEICKTELKKEQQSSNWSSENLTEEQKKYAANDVIYLHRLRNEFINRLYESDRLVLAKEYFAFLPSVCKADLAMFDGAELFNH